MAMCSKYFASSLGSPLRHLAATLSPPFPCIVLFKLPRLFTSTVGNDRSTGYPEAENTCPISDLLLNEYGLCQSEVSTIFKRMPSLVRCRCSHKSQQALRLLRDSGFTEEQEFKNVISICPRLLGSNLEKTLRPNFQYLQNLFGSEVDVSRALKCAPHILIISNGPEILERKLKHLASFGFLEDEIKELIRRCPLTLSVSMDKVQKIMDYLIHTVGLPAEFLLEDPKLLTYSLEFRIKPRHEVLQSISAMEPSKRLPSLTSVVYLGERNFLENYVECSPHATKLLEIYRGNDNALPKD